jgi:hypothetical protein
MLSRRLDCVSSGLAITAGASCSTSSRGMRIHHCRFPASSGDRTTPSGDGGTAESSDAHNRDTVSYNLAYHPGTTLITPVEYRENIRIL